MANCKNAEKGTAEELVAGPALDSNIIWFRVQVAKGAECTFSYSTDGNSFTALGSTFKAREGKWIGAKVGFYAIREGIINDAGSADIDWFRVEK
jgi:hypothetical protein